MAAQANPDAPAGQPEDDRSRLALLDRLLRERFPAPRLSPGVDLGRPGVVPLWTPTG